jgi:flagellar biosynthetic protein FliQ
VLVALAVGLLVGLFQAASQIQEFTLSFVPKILAVLVALALLLPWMGEQLVRFAQAAFSGSW